MKKFISKLPENIKLALYCCLGCIVVALMYYPLIPILLNYPPDSINNSFQIEVNYFYYTVQYATITGVGLIINFLACSLLFRGVNKLQKIKEVDKEKIPNLVKTVKTCFNYPLLVLIVILTVPTLLIYILLILLRQEPAFVIKLTFILFTIISLIALITYSVSKVFFANILKKIGIKGSLYGIRVNIRNKLILQFVPLVLFTILFSYLILYSQISKEKGDSLFDYYKREVENKFSVEVNSVDDAYNMLNEIEFKSDFDAAFILNSDGSIYKSKAQLSDFFTKYIFEYENTHNGRTYDYYGVAIQGAFIRYDINGTSYILGIEYSVFSNDIISSVLPLFIILFVINTMFIVYVARTLRNDIKVISTNLSNIARNAETYVEHRLSVVSNDEIGDLIIAFNKIQEMTKKNIEQIHASQDIIVETERLASLGQMIGGIAHNLKTPIMAVSGATEGILDLTKEYESSIGDKDVTIEDHHEIASEMKEWITKIRDQLEYMSDVITAIKGQAVAFSDEQTSEFTVEALVKNVDILMKHELKNAIITLNINIGIDPKVEIKGSMNSLVQVINNIISNAIQAYNRKTNEEINFSIYKEGNSLMISIEDHAGGLPDKVKDRLFKEMVTTKGKNGSGLGLFMSYSNIKAHFNGKLSFETKQGEGTIFYIGIPL